MNETIEKTIKFSEEGSNTHISIEMLDLLDTDKDVFQQVKDAYHLIPKLSDNTQELIQKRICLQLEQTKGISEWKLQLEWAGQSHCPRCSDSPCRMAALRESTASLRRP